MNLVEAIFRNRKGNLTMKQFVVLELVDVTHAMYAEILYTRFGLGYTKQGGGFSHHQAGINHRGATTMPPGYWAEKQKRLYRSEIFRTNLEDELNRGVETKYICEGFPKIAELQDDILDMGQVSGDVDFPEKNEELVKLIGEHQQEEIALISLLDFDIS